jgi:hypothetical protein
MYEKPNMNEPLVFSDDIKIFSRNAKKSIFVRDLPYCCTSADLGDFFAHALNTPVVHAMVCRNKQGRTLQIGYVLFQSEDSVRLALDTLNGCRFIGRDIRVLPYDPKAPSEPSTTGLVHVSFKTTSTQQPLVTEATIRRAFEAHGELEHVAIRTHKYTDTGLQGGYGFVTFRRPEMNRYIIEQIRQLESNNVFYECSWSSLHTHKGVAGEEVVIDPRYGYIATKASIPGGAPSSRGMNDPYGGGPGYGGARGPMGPGHIGHGPEFDEFSSARRELRDDYRNSNGLPPNAGYDRFGYGGEYDRRGLRGPYPPAGGGGGLPPPLPARAYYDEPYYDDYYRGSRGHVSGRPPFAGGAAVGSGPLYDRGYYEETYRGSAASRFGPSALAPRPAMYGREGLDFPAPSNGFLGEERFGLTGSPRFGSETSGNDLLFGLPSRSTLLGDDAGFAAMSNNELLGSMSERDSLSAFHGSGGTRRSTDSIAAATDTTEFSFDLGRGRSSLSVMGYDFPSNGSSSVPARVSAMPSVGTVRPSRSSWGTDVPDFSRENSRENSEASRPSGNSTTGLPQVPNLNSFWQNSAHFFAKGDKPAASVLEDSFKLVDKYSGAKDPLDDLIDREGDAEDEEIVPRDATLNGVPPGLMSSGSSPTKTIPISCEEDDEDDASSVPPYRDAEIMDPLAKNLELKAIISADK